MAFRTNKTPVLQEKTASGSVASFNCALNKPLVACTTEFMCTQEGSGDPSPSNVRNIVGVDDITLTVNGNSVVIDLDGTRYGGYVDVVGKKLILTSQLFVFDGSENWTRRQVGYSTFQVLKAQMPKIENLKTYYNGIFSIGNMAKLVNTAAITVNQYFISNSLFICDLGIMNNDDFKQALSDQNLIIASEITIPIEISLSDIPTLSTIMGNNSFESDSGDISLTFNDLDLAKRGSFREVFKLP